MSPRSVSSLCLIAGLLVLGPCAGAAPAADLAADTTARWVRMAFGAAADPPLSFSYAGKPFAQSRAVWRLTRRERQLDANRTEHTLRWLDPATGLEVRCVAVAYHDFPTVEWIIHFKNTGAKDTPILADIQALDARFRQPGEGEVVLHHYLGSPARKEDYQPFRSPLGANASKALSAGGGRPSNKDMPYCNIAWHGGGVIIAVGWPGQWAAHFQRDAGGEVHVRAGQERTHFRLHPGEEVRGPLIVLQFWHGNRLDAHNVWRRWMLEHNVPRPGGKLPKPQLCACSSHQFGEMIRANEANQKLFIDRYLAERLGIDYWWMDAGWYVNNGRWENTGTWEVDPKRFPHGLRAITDHAHAKGLKCIVWFEPERVTPNSWLYDKHPEWLLKPPPNPGGQAYEMSWRLLDLGNPDARRWLTDHVDRLIKEQGVDLYRQDCNIDPLMFWRAHDAPDRQGITEIRYVTGYLAYWDELRRRHPNLLIDSCASGGRRLDLETMRRAVTLTRSDYLFEPVGEQCHTYGLAFWLPYYGTGTLVGPSAIGATGTVRVDTYTFRSDMCPSTTACWDVRRKDLDYDRLRVLVAQRRRVAPYFLGDYYPLTPYSTADDAWIAWQFGDGAAEGMVEAFRRPGSGRESMTFRLRGLEAGVRYRVTDLDTEKAVEYTGRRLMKAGLRVVLRDRPGAALLVYRRLATRGARK